MVVAFAANRSCGSPEAVLQATYFRREGGSPKLEPYQERIEHGKVFHVYH